MDKPVLLIDTRNALYRAIFAVKADRRNTIKYHYFTILLRQITSWANMYNPESINIFWDAPRTSVWRRKILPTYKDRTNSTYVEDISEDLFKTTAIAKEFFKVMNVRQFEKKTMEADDLIYSAVTMLHPQKTIVVSTDSDMIQIPFNYDSCTVYNPTKKEETKIPNVNPVVKKAIIGDKSDAIVGYYGIGDKKSQKMLETPSKLQEFLQETGRDVYHRNLLLIDLSLNPKLLHNKLYVQRKMSKPVEFDKKIINELVHKYKVNGILQEYADVIAPFEKLI